jgi:prepilin peptidase CpaA
LGLFLPVFAAGWMGAGDVKLFSAAGGLVGLPQMLPFVFAALMVGGLMAALIFVWMGRGVKGYRLPYAGALLGGALCWMMLR